MIGQNNRGIWWRLVFAVLAIAPIAFSGVAARADDESGRGFNQSADTEMRRSVVAIHDANGRRYDINGILLVADAPGVTGTLAYVYGASSYNAVFPRNESRLGIVKDIPLAGRLFSERIRADDISPANKVGTAYLYDQVLLIDVRDDRARKTEELASPSAAEILDTLDAARSRRGQTSELLMDQGGEQVTIRAISVLNRDYSQTLEARAFVAQAGGVRFFGEPVGGAAGGKGPALSRVPVLGPWFVPVGDVHRSGESLLVVIRPSILVR